MSSRALGWFFRFGGTLEWFSKPNGTLEWFSRSSGTLECPAELWDGSPGPVELWDGSPDEFLRSLAGPPSPPGPVPPGWRVPVDCVRANELCAGEPSCSARYRTLRQCLAGRDRNTLLANRECQVALEVLQGSALYDCRCKRGMRRELQCLQIYWSIHMGLTEGMDPAASSRSNHCLDAAKACNLNDNCKRLRSAYISTCSRELSASEPCSRRKCHKALRQFFDRVPGEFTFRLLFCSCKDPACAERRRQTIVPSCSYEDKDKPNCLDLRGACRADHLCR
ncbi:hypothetical protein TURU_040396 [Turdus rufiventris]|nr:hypothetical protein TURU_040396 [Turdus rufiventris]